MIQEERQLLFKDILGRLQYGVKAHYKYYDFVGGTEQLVSEDDAIITGVNTTLGNPIQVDGYYVEVEYVRPYLRPMSSMTEEERNEATQFEIINLGPIGFNWRLLVSNSSKLVDWLNAHYFDYRGLIEKGLALEASKDMYKSE